jgi:Ceramidase
MIILIVVLACAAVLFMGPIAQPLSYHQLADQRTFFDIPHALDVASNLPFLVIGLMGLKHCVHRPEREVCYSWAVFFVGVSFVALGSAYYHWAPDNQRLVWDRLPMAVAFMGLFIGLLSERIDDKIERYWLMPALILGIVSVVYWGCTDDLRLYGLVQFGPLLMLPVVLLLFEARYTHQRFLLYALVWYAAAKLCEAFDREIFLVTSRIVSGHTLKHLFAAAAVWCVYRMLIEREPVADFGTAKQ